VCVAVQCSGDVLGTDARVADEAANMAEGAEGAGQRAKQRVRRIGPRIDCCFKHGVFRGVMTTGVKYIVRTDCGTSDEAQAASQMAEERARW
jgi:hypothetical protein